MSFELIVLLVLTAVLCVFTVYVNGKKSSDSNFSGSGTYSYINTKEADDSKYKVFERSYTLNTISGALAGKTQILLRTETNDCEYYPLNQLFIAGDVPGGCADGDKIGSIAEDGETKKYSYQSGDETINLKITNNTSTSNSLEVVFC